MLFNVIRSVSKHGGAPTMEAKRVDSIEAVDRNQWNHVVEQSDLGCIYHRYGWLQAVESGTPYEPRHLVISRENNSIAIYPNFLTEVGPFRQLTSIVPGFGGPIVVTDEERAIELFLEAIPRLYDGTIFFSRIRSSIRNTSVITTSSRSMATTCRPTGADSRSILRWAGSNCSNGWTDRDAGQSETGAI